MSSRVQPITIEGAIDAFMRGFAFTRSFTHPYEIVEIGRLRIMRDSPRASGDYRNEEIVFTGIDEREAVDAIWTYAPTKFAVCAIYPTESRAKEGKTILKGLGFRLLRREPLMARATSGVTLGETPFSIRRVRAREEAELIARSAGRQILPEHLDREDSPLRLYSAYDNENPVGWVRSVDAGGDRRWVSNLAVRSEYKRRGIGSALMNAMLIDDHRFGAEHSVLLASSEGTMLYPRIGYKQLGVLYLYVPVWKKRAGV